MPLRQRSTLTLNKTPSMHTAEGDVQSSALLKLLIEFLSISKWGEYGSGIRHFIYGDVFVTSSIVLRYQAF